MGALLVHWRRCCAHPHETTLLTALLSRQQLAGGESHPTEWLLFRSRTPLSES